jgi:hypothetical protein
MLSSSQDSDVLLRSETNETTSRKNAATMVHAFIRVWKNERCSPELQKYEGDLIEKLFHILSKEELHAKQLAQNVHITSEAAFFAKMVSIDIERLRFMIKNYLTIRLQKVIVVTIKKNPESILYPFS